MYIEYPAVKNLIKPKKSILIKETDEIDVINIISLIKLIDGGAAMFAIANINHHIEITGEKIIQPLDK